MEPRVADWKLVSAGSVSYGSLFARERNMQDRNQLWDQGCQMAKFDHFLSLDWAREEGVGAQSKERKGSNFAVQRSGAMV